MIRLRRTATATLALGAVVVAVFGSAGPASAHITVDPKEATQGGYGRFAFRVPNESDTESTTKVEIFLPENAPLGSVSTMLVPGWTAVVEKRTLDEPVEVHGSQLSEAVSKVTWTAEPEAAIAPGTFQEFPVSVGPLPTVDTMVFKSLQTYSDGTIVRWIDEPTADGVEPEQPAPVLELVAVAASADPATEGEARVADDGQEAGGGLAIGLGVAGLVAGLGGLVLGGLAFTRSRREPTPKV
ncbi:YcnI family copper-binding membrane protein [Salinispora arenicola]|uniref:YcnI family copper-binding membrane protein n=1 Tax=Salinispora arenicola TaxID=168697 RepID=UPI00207AFB93|nr:YcnI family protein [Salinispora arenicola]MCN0154180.1 YcnI family protein [Salinispora arenicola]